MKIVDAVRRSIEENSDDCWFVYTAARVSHHWHVTVTCAVDGFDSQVFNRLARGEPSARGCMTFTERRDGTLRPRLILPRETGPSFEHGQPMAGGRRVSDKVTA